MFLLCIRIDLQRANRLHACTLETVQHMRASRRGGIKDVRMAESSQLVMAGRLQCMSYPPSTPIGCDI